MSPRLAHSWLRHAFVLTLMLAVILLGAAAKRSQYPAHPGPSSHLSKLVKMSECRIDFHVDEIGVLHEPSAILEFGVTFIAAPRLRVFPPSVIAPVGQPSPPLRV